jgi:hypothetical protein
MVRRAIAPREFAASATTGIRFNPSADGITLKLKG